MGVRRTLDPLAGLRGAALLVVCAYAGAALPGRPRSWPAVAGILAFAWLELCYAHKDDPAKVAAIALGYAALQLVGMALYGIEEWSDKGDAFGSYFGLFGRPAPLRWGDGALWRRRPLAGILGMSARWRASSA